jgi:hypothetical protein
MSVMYAAIRWSKTYRKGPGCFLGCAKTDQLDSCVYAAHESTAHTHAHVNVVGISECA